MPWAVVRLPKLGGSAPRSSEQGCATFRRSAWLPGAEAPARSVHLPVDCTVAGVEQSFLQSWLPLPAQECQPFESPGCSERAWCCGCAPPHPSSLMESEAPSAGATLSTRRRLVPLLFGRPSGRLAPRRGATLAPPSSHSFGFFRAEADGAWESCSWGRLSSISRAARRSCSPTELSCSNRKTRSYLPKAQILLISCCREQMHGKERSCRRLSLQVLAVDQ